MREFDYFGVETSPLPQNPAEMYLIEMSKKGYFLYAVPVTTVLNTLEKILPAEYVKQKPSYSQRFNFKKCSDIEYQKPTSITCARATVPKECRESEKFSNRCCIVF